MNQHVKSDHQYSLSAHDQFNLDCQRLQLLISALAKASFALPAVFSLFTVLFWPYADHAMLIAWLTGIVILSGYRYWLYQQQLAQVSLTESQLPWWFKRVLIVDLLTGFLLGISGMFLPELPLEYQGLLLLVLVAISMNGSVSHAPFYASFVCFLLPLYSIFALFLLLLHTNTSYILLLLLVVNLFFIYGNFKTVHKQLLDNLKLSYINQLVTSELQANNQALIESNQQVKLASRAKSQFIADLSEKIAKPLSELDQLIQKHKANSFQAQKLSTNTLNLLNRLLQSNQIEKGILKPDIHHFLVRPLIENQVTHISSKAQQKSIRLYCHIDSKLPSKLCSDGSFIQQILHHLLDNAVKFTNQGFISVQLGYSQHQQQENLIITVSDSGIGIASDQLAHIFEPFIGDTEVGNGLGLALCKQLTELLGGHISVSSSVGSGSSFRCVIPVQAASYQVPSYHHGKPVIIFETDVIQQQALIQQLQYLQVPFELITDSKELMTICAKEHKKYSLLIIGGDDAITQSLLANLCQRLKLTYIKLSHQPTKDSHTSNLPLTTASLCQLLSINLPPE